MQTLYRWHCPKCGKKYVNGEEPTFCEEQLSLHAPEHPSADAATGLVSVKCGAPILPLTPPEAEREKAGESSDRPQWGGPDEEPASERTAEPDGPIMDTIMGVIRARSWRHVRYAQWCMVEVSLQCEHTEIRLVASASEQRQQVMVRALIAAKVPVARRAAVAEYVTRANYNFFIGSFDLDLDEGHLAFRAGIDLTGGELTDTMVATLLDRTSFAADRHHEQLMKVVHGGMEPKAALAELSE